VILRAGLGGLKQLRMTLVDAGLCVVLSNVPLYLLVGFVIFAVGREWQAALAGSLFGSCACGLNCWH